MACDHPVNFFNETTFGIDCALCGVQLLAPVGPEELVRRTRRAERRQKWLVGTLEGASA